MQAERAWLRWVRQAAAHATTPPAELRLGIGDDAALLQPRQGWELALTTDLLVEGVHFLRHRDSAARCGRRLATRALSDLAAMGSEPLALLVSSLYPKTLPASWPRQLYRGLLEAGREAGAALIGGDVAMAARSPIVLDVIGVGQVPSGSALTRSGARAGERILVSGRLGEAALGRQLVHGGRPGRGAEQRRARARHQRPRARWELGIKLRGLASAAIDLSDGLATDLHHLCRASGVGAEIAAAGLPAAPGAAGLRRALFGGEDYELLFTLPQRRRLPAFPDLHCIGVITAARGVWLRRPDGSRLRIPDAGFEH
ncbi:MAG: thiamine-phosphate kinase [Terriglobales bacterium]